ncbi:MAG TPA: spore protease YyaC [Firmicutes bacterium]|nr:spore protease YyaC [Bacillota bacterium]
MPKGLRVSVDDALAAQKLGHSLWHDIRHLAPASHRLVALCIGSDRSTGDALGPLTGSFLEELACPQLKVMGTLAQPVHATNLENMMASLQTEPGKPCVIAIDACLGRLESVGKIALSAGALNPGAGVNKELPPVGDYNIVGIVNVSGFMEHLVLQNTRLHLVYRMANIIADAIATLCYRLATSYPAAGQGTRP